MDESEDTLAKVTMAISEQLGQHKHGCIIIHGAIGEGKTRFGERLVIALRESNIKVGGIISPRILSGNDTIGYRVRDIDTGGERLLATMNPPGVRVGKFYLLQNALDFVRKAIESAAVAAQVVLLDEVGRLELDDKGHATALRALLRSETIPVLFVRSKFVQRVIQKFSILDHAEFPVDRSHVVR